MAYRCLRRSLAGLPAVPVFEVLFVHLIGEVFVKLFEVVVVQVVLDVPSVLWLLVGCRVRVAARAPPLQ